MSAIIKITNTSQLGKNLKKCPALPLPDGLYDKTLRRVTSKEAAKEWIKANMQVIYICNNIEQRYYVRYINSTEADNGANRVSALSWSPTKNIISLIWLK